MIRKPWFTFDNTADTWVEKIPQYSNVHIIDDSNPSDGSGVVKLINVHDITGLTNTTTVQELLDLPLQWTEIGGIERGGIAWEIDTNYAKGDMVVNLSDFATYKCIINDNLGNVPSSAFSGWERAIPDERGGLAWAIDAEYFQGDIVYDITDDTPYVAIVATVADLATPPADNLLEWKAITGTAGSMLVADYRFVDTIAGDPGVGNASLNNADDTLATTLFISYTDEDNGDRSYGLDMLESGDFISYREHGNNPNHYTYVITGDGIDQGTFIEFPVAHHSSNVSGELANNERISVEVLFVRKPQIPERGGIAWETGINYQPGDIVMSDAAGPGMWESYYCVAPNTSIGGDLPLDLSPSWAVHTTEERGGVMVTLGNSYVVGDIVTDDLNQEAYRCILDNAGTQPSTTPTDWVTLEPHGYIAETGTATYTPDFTTDDFFDYTLTQNADLIVPSDIKPGDTGTIVIRQDATGGWNPTWAPNYQWADGLPILEMTPDWVHIFEYSCISADHVVMEYVTDLQLMPVVLTAPSVINDFNATDTLIGNVVVTWTDSIGLPAPTYDLYDDTNTLLVSGITSGYSYTYTGTKDFYVKAINSEGFADSNSESGTGVVVTTLVAITDFAATDAQTGYVEVTFTEQ